MIDRYQELRRRGYSPTDAYQRIVEDLSADIKTLAIYYIVARDAPGKLDEEREFFARQGFDMIPAEACLERLKYER